MSIFGNSKIRELELRITGLERELQETSDKNAADIFRLKATIEKNVIESAAKDRQISQLRADVEAKEREITKLLNEAQLHRR
jgi:hypothetical protein